MRALEETFDGWLRLTPGGWIQRQGSGGPCLRSKGFTPSVALGSGRQMFEVIGPEALARSRPSPKGEVLRSFLPGKLLLAETQTFDGWLRLAGELGWVLRAQNGRELLSHVSKDMHVFRQQEDEEEAERRRLAEAQVLRDIDHARRSGWWRKLEEDGTRAPIQRCSRLPLHSQTPAAALLSRSHLPSWDFRVVHEAVSVRAGPDSEAPVCGGFNFGDVIAAQEETFDGWVHLVNNAGWLQKALPANSGAEIFLQPLRGLEALPSPTLARLPGRQMFEVIAPEGVDVFREPMSGALLLGNRSFGEFLLAETQTYHGWIHLSEEEGWAPAFSSAGIRLLQPVRPEDLQLSVTGQEESEPAHPDPQDSAVALAEAARREALRQLEMAVSGSSAIFCAAVELARQKGVSKRDLARVSALRDSLPR